MIDWKSLIKKFHKRIPAGYVLHLAPPANADQLESAKNALPAIIPSEIFELYAACNGCSLDAGARNIGFSYHSKEWEACGNRPNNGF